MPIKETNIYLFIGGKGMVEISIVDHLQFIRKKYRGQSIKGHRNVVQMKKYHQEHRLQVYLYAFMYVYNETITEE